MQERENRYSETLKQALLRANTEGTTVSFDPKSYSPDDLFSEQEPLKEVPQEAPPKQPLKEKEKEPVKLTRLSYGQQKAIDRFLSDKLVVVHVDESRVKHVKYLGDMNDEVIAQLMTDQLGTKITFSNVQTVREQAYGPLYKESSENYKDARQVSREVWERIEFIAGRLEELEDEMELRLMNHSVVLTRIEGDLSGLKAAMASLLPGTSKRK